MRYGFVPVKKFPRQDQPCHLRFKVRLGRVEKSGCSHRRHDICDQYTSTTRSGQSNKIAQVLVAQCQRDSRHIIRCKPGVYNGLQQLCQHTERYRHIEWPKGKINSVNRQSGNNLVGINHTDMDLFKKSKYASQIRRWHDTAYFSYLVFGTSERGCHGTFINVHENDLAILLGKFRQYDVVQMTWSQDTQPMHVRWQLSEDGHHMGTMGRPSR